MNQRPSNFKALDQAQSEGIPAAPVVTLRIGFIGHRRLRPDSLAKIEAEITRCFASIAKNVLSVHPRHSTVDNTPLVTRFYDREAKPVLRLVTGLAEGADLLANKAFEKIKADSQFQRDFSFEQAGVIPFALQEYLDGRDEDFRPTLVNLLKQPDFRYLTVLDGIYEKPEPDTELAKTRRRRGYRAQSEFLLRQSDVLVAVADPELGEEKPGGTLEAIRNALSFYIPVILIRTRHCHQTEQPTEGVPEISVRVFHPGEAFQFVAEGRKDSDEPDRLESLIRDEILAILADPDTENEDYGPRRLHSGHQELITFFHQPETPPRKSSDADKNGGVRSERAPTFRERVWTRAERHFRKPVDGTINEHRDAFQSRADGVVRTEKPINTDDLQSSYQKNSPFKAYRNRSTELNYHFSGLYRGTYLLNFTLAVIAVALASVSLACLAIENTPAWTKWLLVVFALAKLGILLWIVITTHQANHNKYSQLAVDFRYLAERLRAMQFLPSIGSFQAPQPETALDAQRMARQSSAEWLFQAIVRSISPERYAKSTSITLKVGEGTETLTLSILQPEPTKAAAFIRKFWLEEQIHYHQQSSLRHRAMADAMRSGASTCGMWVIAAVVLDVILATLEALHYIPPGWTALAAKCSVFLMVVTGLVPAAVASLNGIRVQSECERLADRHHFMRLILGGRPAKESKQKIVAGSLALGGYWSRFSRLIAKVQNKSEPQINIGTWSADVLELTEELATDMVREVSEWSVVYDREVIEP